MSEIFVFAPHTDDESLGAGASLSRWRRMGYSISIVAFSVGQAHYTEFQSVSKYFGVTGFWYDFTVRRFDQSRQSILDLIIYFRDEYNPSLVLCPSSNDIHQDHEVIHREVFRAFRSSTSILGFDLPWNSQGEKNTLYVEMDQRGFIDKLRAVETYKSQGSRPYTSRDVILAQARLRGLKAGFCCAEAFEVIRWRSNGIEL